VRDGAAALDLSDYRIRLGPVGCIALAEALSRPKLQVTTGQGVLNIRLFSPSLPYLPRSLSPSLPPPLPLDARTHARARSHALARPHPRASRQGVLRTRKGVHTHTHSHTHPHPLTVLLNTCDITAKGATSIGEAMRINMTITKLDLNSNQISDAGATAIADALRGNEVLNPKP